MSKIDSRKIVVFGAGKIGRSFIGQLFSRGGYEVVFVDINRPLIEELNARKHYKVIIRAECEQIMDIVNVRGVCLYDENEAIEEVATAGIVGTSVGLAGLNGVFPVLAKGLVRRYTEFSDHPLDIVIAENMRNADVFFREKLLEHLPGSYPFGSLVGLVETSIGKMVPIMHKKDVEGDMLQIFAEPYNTLILNRKGFINEVPDIEGLAPKENMKAWVDRKLFIHNLGHSATSYFGYLHRPDLVFLWEALAIPEIFIFVKRTMLQSADILLAEYPGEFTQKSLVEHIDDLLSRFQNRALGDTIFRVGCDLKRKLGQDDRLAGAIHKAFDIGLPYERILFALVCGCYFNARDEENRRFPEDVVFHKYYGNDVNSISVQICGFDKIRHKRILDEASLIDNMIKISGVVESMRIFT